MATKPGLISGANAKIKIGDKTMAYATEISYRVAVTTLPIEVMGKPEVIDNVPVAYNVDGSFSIIRRIGDSNSPTQWTMTTKDGTHNVNEQLDPFKMLESQSFDIEVFLKKTIVGGLSDKIMKFKNCRITGRSSKIDKRSVYIEDFSFSGELFDDDSSSVTDDVISDLS